MNRKKLLVLLLVVLCSSLWAKVGDTMYVKVKEAKLKTGTGFFAAELHSLDYGDSVKITHEKGKWVQVESTKNSDVSGWIPLAELTKKKILVGHSVKTSADEIALAGKGFSAQVEEAYKQSSSIRTYNLVDEIEQLDLPPEELYNFIVEGVLAGGEK